MDNQKRSEHEEMKLTQLRVRIEEAEKLAASKDGKVESLKSLIEAMGKEAEEEWKRLDTDQRIRDEKRQVPEPYRPAPYYVGMIGVNLASRFTKGAMPSMIELSARLSLIDDAIKHARGVS